MKKAFCPLLKNIWIKNIKKLILPLIVSIVLLTSLPSAHAELQHDVAILDVTGYPDRVHEGDTVIFDVTFANLGLETETFNWSVCIRVGPVSFHISGSPKNITLAPGATVVIQYWWDTTGFPPGVYIRYAEAQLDGDMDLTNNQKDSNPITIMKPFGGIAIPVDKLALLAPYIGLASTILVATAATAIYVKHVKRRKEKQ